MDNWNLKEKLDEYIEECKKSRDLPFCDQVLKLVEVQVEILRKKLIEDLIDYTNIDRKRFTSRTIKGIINKRFGVK